MKKAILILLIAASACTAPVEYEYPFQDPERTVEERAENIVSLLRLDEKVGQMMNDAPAIERLGIPAYNWWNECLHGVARTSYNVTSFPQAIGMAATWDVESMALMAEYASDEGRAIYNDASAKGNYSIYHGLTYWSPNVNIFRDPRWGRGQETYGEDPYLTSELGKTFVKGLQGDDPRYLKSSACAKHYAVHSGPEWNRSTFNAVVSDQDLWDTYLPAFEALVKDADVSAVMCAYNAFDGRPCCGSDRLMIDILRNQWGFDGYVTSDCGGINHFHRTHRTHPDKKSASADAVLHGTDCECSSDGAYNDLGLAVAEGLITEEQIDESLKRLFETRIRLGMFDPKEMVPYSSVGIDVLERPEHAAHALKMARQSIVLLKNEENILPLSKEIRKIALLGPNAADTTVMLGNYFGNPSKVWSVLEGLEERLGDSVEIDYHKCCGYVDGGEDFDPATVADADLIIFAGGICPDLEGESMPVDAVGFKGGDRLTIELPQAQRNILKKLDSLGKPVVFVMLSGSAVAIEWEDENIPAIVNAWYPGQAGGLAIADVLTGAYNPAGRLPVTFYRSDADLPDYEDYSMDNRTYRYFRGEPLYPFGYGLSYTDFAYSDMKVRKVKDGYKISVAVENIGAVDGEEVVQLYVSSGKEDFRTPIRSLKGFDRIMLAAGESQKVSFFVPEEQLQVVNENGDRIPMKSPLCFYAGGGQPDGRNSSVSFEIR